MKKLLIGIGAALILAACNDQTIPTQAQVYDKDGNPVAQAPQQQGHPFLEGMAGGFLGGILGNMMGRSTPPPQPTIIQSQPSTTVTRNVTVNKTIIVQPAKKDEKKVEPPKPTVIPPPRTVTPPPVPTSPSKPSQYTGPQSYKPSPPPTYRPSPAPSRSFSSTPSRGR